MESSKLFGGTEECHSSESGWTMYIGSPIHSDDGDDGDDGDDNNYDDDAGDDDSSDANNEDDSDDSMASDASSGPSHQGNPYGHGMANFKHEKGKGNDKYCLEKKADKAVEKQRTERGRKEEKEERVLMATRANTATQSGSKVRKNIWMGKRK